MALLLGYRIPADVRPLGRPGMVWNGSAAGRQEIFPLRYSVACDTQVDCAGRQHQNVKIRRRHARILDRCDLVKKQDNKYIHPVNLIALDPNLRWRPNFESLRRYKLFTDRSVCWNIRRCLCTSPSRWRIQSP